METPLSLPPARDPAEVLNPRIWSALRLLQEALDGAATVHQEAWEFAVEISELQAAGLTTTDLRWLLCKGYAEQRAERAGGPAGRRAFQRVNSLRLCARSCFVLTAAGTKLFTGRPGPTPAPSLFCPGAAGAGAGSRLGLPRWDGDRRQLSIGGQLIKEFRTPAMNQETILAALEEEGWPVRIDDPLPQTTGLDPRCRLQETIKRLNRNQITPLLRFSGDGYGQGVRWSAVR